MKTFLFAALLPIASLTGYEASGKISACHADYDGNALKLDGKVFVDHSLGAMHAEQATLYKEKEGEDFHLIELQKEVAVTLESGAKLLCDKACFNFLSMSAALQAEDGGKVRYSDTVVSSKGQSFSILMEGPKVDLKMKEGAASKYLIDTIEAKDLVSLSLNSGQMRLLADKICYSACLSKDTAIITAICGKDLCCLTRGDDKIYSEKIDMDVASSKATLSNAHGKLYSSHSDSKASISFSSTEAVLDEEQGVVHLNGASEVIEPTIGKIHTEEKLSLKRSIENGRQTLAEISTKGKTKLMYKDAATHAEHYVTCHGTMVVNRSLMQANLTSPGYNEGSVLPSEQLCYHDELMQVFASHCWQQFAEEEGMLVLAALKLDGNVRLSSLEGALMGRYALAGSMSYDTKEKKIILKAAPGKKVLFWDQEQSLTISAHEVHISKDPVTQKSAIQGVGNVKLSLSEEENDLLRVSFPSLTNQHITP